MRGNDTLDVTVDRPIGGQAVIEGVMIKSPDRISTAIRRSDGTIVVKTKDYAGLASRHRLLRLPLIRGAMSFAEMLSIGMEALNFSARIAAEDDGDVEPETPIQRVLGWLIMAGSIVLAMGLFLFIPLSIAEYLVPREQAMTYNLVAGGVRAVVFLVYIWSIGRMADMRRVFEYHGAEHQSVFAYEAGQELSPDNAAGFQRFHPRCGTSFILIVVFLAILAYGLIDSAFVIAFGRPETLIERFGVHLAFLPVVAGVSFEALKLSGKHRGSRVVKTLVAPGLWLQRLTTRQPDEAQLEVAVAAARASLGLPTTNAVEYVPLDTLTGRPATEKSAS